LAWAAGTAGVPAPSGALPWAAELIEEGSGNNADIGEQPHKRMPQP